MWEVTIARACFLRGAEVKYVLCDGVYTDCDIHWAVTRPRTETSCRDCMAVAQQAFKTFSMPYDWLGQYIPPEAYEEARTWADSHEVSEFMTASYKNHPIGEWVRSSLHSHFRQTYLDFDDPKIVEAYRSYLYSGAVAYEGLTRLMDHFCPNVMLLFNGRMSNTRIAFELARRRDIRVILHERGSKRDTLRLSENSLFSNLERRNRIWSIWEDEPLFATEMEATGKHLENRRRGRGTNWHSFLDPSQSQESISETQIRTSLGLRQNSKVVVLFTSSEDEIIAAKESRNIADVYERQIDWLKHAIGLVKERPQCDLVIRIHPNTAGKRAVLGSNTQALDEILNLKETLSDNVRLVLPEEPVDSYTLMEIARVGLTYRSTVTLEMASLGKPVVVASRGVCYDKPFAVSLASPEELPRALDEALEQPLSREVMRSAYRFAYHRFLRMNIPFPLVSVIKVHAGKLNYASLDELKPGREPNLDRIVSFVLGEKPLIDPPDPKRRIEAAPEEDRFLNSLPLGRWPEPRQKDEIDILPGQGTPGLTSIIVLNLNGSAHIRQCVESIKACTKVPYELIVVDNGSTDDSLTYLRSLANIKLIENPENVGAPYARNQGLALAEGEYIVFLDNDTVVAKRWLQRFIAYAKASPLIGVWGPRSNFVSGPQLVQHAQYSNEEELQTFARGWAAANAGQASHASRLILFCLFVKREVI